MLNCLHNLDKNACQICFLIAPPQPRPDWSYESNYIAVWRCNYNYPHNYSVEAVAAAWKRLFGDTLETAPQASDVWKFTYNKGTHTSEYTRLLDGRMYVTVYSRIPGKRPQPPMISVIGLVVDGPKHLVARDLDCTSLTTCGWVLPKKQDKPLSQCVLDRSKTSCAECLKLAK